MSTPPAYPEPSQPPLAYETPRAQWNAVTIGSIALKIMGVYCFTQVIPAVSLLSAFSSFPTRQGYALQLISAVAIYAIYLAFGFAFIFFAGPLSRRLFRDETTQAAISEMPVGPYLQAVAFSILGVWLLIEGVVSFAYRIAAYNINARGMISSLTVLEPVLRAALGLFLIFRGPALALLWHKLRTGGTIHPDRE